MISAITTQQDGVLFGDHTSRPSCNQLINDTLGYFPFVLLYLGRVPNVDHRAVGDVRYAREFRVTPVLNEITMDSPLLRVRPLDLLYRTRTKDVVHT